MLPIEIIELIFSHTGEVGLWKIFNHRYLQTKLPKHLCDIMQRQRLTNYLYENHKIVYLDFFDDEKFNLIFAKTLLTEFYGRNETRKCLTVLMVIMNDIIFYRDAREAIEFGKTIPFYENLKSYIHNDIIYHVKKFPNYQPYLWFPNVSDLEKFVLFTEICEFHYTEVPMLRFANLIRKKEIMFNDELTVCGDLYFQLSSCICRCTFPGHRDPRGEDQINELFDEIHESILCLEIDEKNKYKLTKKNVRRKQLMYYKHFL